LLYLVTNPEIEKITCELLGLKPDIASTQVISRDRHAEYVQTIALIGASLDRFATEIRNLQRTDVLEVEEGFSKGQKGSSAMPHKRNPIRSERVSGLSRILRSYVVTALENVPLWHERDISHSSNERIMLPDVSICLHFMLREMKEIISDLKGLKPDTASTQVISRDRHAEYVQTIALIGASLDRFATEIRNLQRTDVLEVEEGFSKGQKGSSAMPHKRNPIRSERVSGLSRILRSYVVTALENVPLWHERDISHSSNERIMLPDVSICRHFMLREMKEIINNLKVYPDNMLKNLNIYGGVIFSQKVLLLLVEKGMSREKAYSLVQKSAHQAWNNENGNFKENIEGDQEIMTLVSENDLKVCFDPSIHLNNLNVIWDKLSI
jgi:adenylosuccinate lyase